MTSSTCPAHAGPHPSDPNEEKIMSQRFATAVAATAVIATTVAAPTLAHATSERPSLARSASTSALVSTGDHQRFAMTLTEIRGKDRPTRVVAAGPIQARGTMVQRVVKQGRRGEVIKAVLTLPHGKVTLRVHDRSAMKLDLHSCTARENGKGSWRIVSATGAYRGSTGHGSFVRRTFIIGAFDDSGHCLGQSAPPASVTASVVADGTAHR